MCACPSARARACVQDFRAWLPPEHIEDLAKEVATRRSASCRGGEAPTPLTITATFLPARSAQQINAELCSTGCNCVRVCVEVEEGR
jgi:hypothetical protein